MTRAVLHLVTDEIRERAIRWIREAKHDTRVEFKAPKRTLPQNDKMWACLTDIAMQVPWHGLKLTTEDWKLVFLDGLKRELRLVPNLDGTGFVNLGRSSSDLGVEEMADMITLILQFGDAHGVVWSEPKKKEAEAA